MFKAAEADGKIFIPSRKREELMLRSYGESEKERPL